MDFYHVLNRGVDRRKVVLSDADRERFVHGLIAFNDAARVDPNHTRAGWVADPERERLVAIHAWCLMNNHYHLLVSPLVEDGVSKFTHKQGMGYAKYFNERNGRVGHLWQNRAKVILVKSDGHFMYLPYYIHLNPLDTEFGAWREGKLHDPTRALEFLESYRWSSHRDYLGEATYPSTISTTVLAPLFKSKKAYEREISRLITNPAQSAQLTSFN